MCHHWEGKNYAREWHKRSTGKGTQETTETREKSYRCSAGFKRNTDKNSRSNRKIARRGTRVEENRRPDASKNAREYTKETTDWPRKRGRRQV